MRVNWSKTIFFLVIFTSFAEAQTCINFYSLVKDFEIIPRSSSIYSIFQVPPQSSLLIDRNLRLFVEDGSNQPRKSAVSFSGGKLQFTDDVNQPAVFLSTDKTKLVQLGENGEFLLSYSLTERYNERAKIQMVPLQRIEMNSFNQLMIGLSTDRRSLEMINQIQFDLYADRKIYDISSHSVSFGEGNRNKSPIISSYNLFRRTINSVERTFLGVIWSSGHIQFLEVVEQINHMNNKVYSYSPIFFDSFSHGSVPVHVINDTAEARVLIKKQFDNLVLLGLQMGLKTLNTEERQFQMERPLNLTSVGGKSSLPSSKDNMVAEIKNGQLQIGSAESSYRETVKVDESEYLTDKQNKLFDLTGSQIVWSKSGYYFTIVGPSEVLYLVRPINMDGFFKAHVEKVHLGRVIKRPSEITNHDVKIISSDVFSVTNKDGVEREYVGTLWSNGTLVVQAMVIDSFYGLAAKTVFSESVAPAFINQSLQANPGDKKQILNHVFDTYFSTAAKVLDPQFR